MQNVQKLTGTGGTSNYVCKYIAKIDEQNYVIIEVNDEGKIVSKSSFLHNTKVSLSKIASDKERASHAKKINAHIITKNEMLHVHMKYPKVIANLLFIKVTTMPHQKILHCYVYCLPFVFFYIECL